MSDPNFTNNLMRRTEPLLTPAKLKERFLFGVEIIDNEGNELSEETLQAYIDMAVSELEHDLDIPIVPTEICEEKDYFSNDYYGWGYFQLNTLPLIQMKEMNVVYLEDDPSTPASQGEVVLEIPQSWWRVREHDGIVRLVPNNRFPARLAVDNAGAFFPELFRRNGHVPNLWRIKYDAGFKDGCVPMAINAAVGLMASIYALNIAGDLVLGAGIASSSLSIDGLSQSINTTSSAENHAYSAKVLQYGNQLFGPNERTPGILDKLRRYYQGQNFNII